MMRRAAFWTTTAVLALVLSQGAARANVTEDQFTLRTTEDFVALCTADAKDPLYTAAVNYCHGFATGAYSAERDHEAATHRQIFCIPSPAPTRAAAVADFVAWTKEDPARLQLSPIDGIFTYLIQKYPCPKPAPHAKPRS